MTIDEAIAKYKEITNTDANCQAHCNISCDKCVQESEQLAEWLEELKDYRDKNKMVVRVDVENMDSIKDKIEELSKYAESQYNKAIDDFAEKAIKIVYEANNRERNPQPRDMVADIHYKFIDLSEQLKAGGDNEQSI